LSLKKQFFVFSDGAEFGLIDNNFKIFVSASVFGESANMLVKKHLSNRGSV